MMSFFNKATFFEMGISEMAVGKVGGFTAARRTFDKAFLDEIRLIDLLDSARVFAEGCGYCRKSDRTALELGDNRREQFVVDFVKAVSVDVEGFECIAGDVDFHHAIAFDLGEVAHTAQ